MKTAKKIATCQWVCPRTKASLWWVTDFVAEKTGLSFLLAAEEDFVGSPNSQSGYSQIDFDDNVTLIFNERGTKTTVKTLDSKYNDLLIPNYWGDVAEKLLDLYGAEIDNELICRLYYGHLFILKKSSNLEIPKDDLYICTAILPPEPLFAMISTKYKMPENPTWITFRSSSFEEFANQLKNFQIIGLAQKSNVIGNTNFCSLIDASKFNALIAKSHVNV